MTDIPDTPDNNEPSHSPVSPEEPADVDPPANLTDVENRESEADTTSPRILGYDVARAFAFFGMVIVNYRLTMSGFGSRRAGDDHETLREFMGHFTGRAAATFVILAGIGLTLLYRSRRDPDPTPTKPSLNDGLRYLFLLLFLSGCALVIDGHATLAGGKTVSYEGFFDWWAAFKSHLSTFSMNKFTWTASGLMLGLVAATPFLARRSPRLVLFKRGMFLLGLGFAWHPAWTGDILHFYGVYLMLGALMVGLPSVYLWGILAFTLLGGIYAQYSVAFWDSWTTFLTYRDLWTPLGAARNMFINGWHPVFPWIAFLVVGLLVGRMDGRRPSRGLLILGIGILITFGVKTGVDDLEESTHTLIRQRGRSAFETVSLVPSNNWWRGSPEVSVEPTGRRIPTIVDLPEDHQSREVLERNAKRVARVLAGGRESRDYDRYRVVVKNVEVDGQQRPSIVLEVDYGKSMPAPSNHERHLDAIVFSTAARWASSREGGSRGGWGGGAAWPKDVDLLPIERTFPVANPDTPGAEPVQAAVDRTWLTTEGVEKVGKLSRLLQMTSTESTPPGTFYIIAACGTSFIVIGLCLLLTGIARIRRIWRPFVETGQMALTLYVFHVGALFPLFDWFGVRQNQGITRVAMNIMFCWLAAVVLAVVWRRIFKKGPLEMLMRGATG